MSTNKTSCDPFSDSEFVQVVRPRVCRIALLFVPNATDAETVLGVVEDGREFAAGAIRGICNRQSSYWDVTLSTDTSINFKTLLLINTK